MWRSTGWSRSAAAGILPSGHTPAGSSERRSRSRAASPATSARMRAGRASRPRRHRMGRMPLCPRSRRRSRCARARARRPAARPGSRDSRHPHAAEIVDAHHGLDVVEIDLCQCLPGRDPGVVDQESRRRMPREHSCRERLDVRAVADIADLDLGADLGRDLSQAIFPSGDEHTVPTVFCQGSGGGLSDPGGRTGDDGDGLHRVNVTHVVARGPSCRRHPRLRGRRPTAASGRAGTRHPVAGTPFAARAPQACRGRGRHGLAVGRAAGSRGHRPGGARSGRGRRRRTSRPRILFPRPLPPGGWRCAATASRSGTSLPPAVDRPRHEGRERAWRHRRRGAGRGRPAPCGSRRSSPVRRRRACRRSVPGAHHEAVERGRLELADHVRGDHELGGRSRRAGIADGPGWACRSTVGPVAASAFAARAISGSASTSSTCRFRARPRPPPRLRSPVLRRGREPTPVANQVARASTCRNTSATAA